MPRSHKNMVVICVGAICTIAAIVRFPLFSNAQTIHDPKTAPKFVSNPTSSLPTTNHYIEKMQRGELTLGELIDGLGETDALERHQAGEAIIALRKHYITMSANVLTAAYAKKVQPAYEYHAFNALSYMRPSDINILSGAAQHLDFNPLPKYSMDGFIQDGHVAAELLTRSSLPALPILSIVLKESSQKVGNDENLLASACVSAILGPSAKRWQEQSLLMTSDTPTATAKSSSQHQAANRSIVTGRFSKPEFLGELFDNNDLNATPISDYKIQWDAPKGLTSNTFGNDRPFAPWPSQHTTQTILSEHEITRVMALLQYNIALRLNSDTNIKTPQKIVPYPIAARVDAVRVLGCLRPTSFASYVIWQRLRVFSTTKFIDQDSSNETQADLRALGQIDIPAVKFLGERIASEWDTKQQRAANYALSKVLGRYSLPFIEHEIAVRELAAKDDSELHDQYLDEVKRLKDMLELGKEKEWFTGDYYGAHDPHAYDLVFDDTPAPAKTP